MLLLVASFSRVRDLGGMFLWSPWWCCCCTVSLYPLSLCLSPTVACCCIVLWSVLSVQLWAARVTDQEHCPLPASLIMRNQGQTQASLIPELWTHCCRDVLNNKGSCETMCSPWFWLFPKMVPDSKTWGEVSTDVWSWEEPGLDSQSQRVLNLTFTQITKSQL